MVPSGASEHPPGSLAAGQRFVRNLITSLMKSPYWWNSAFMWSYDDWGGWFDHVPPPRVDAYGYGFRVPTLLVSSYAKRGHIDSTELDFTSFLKFIEVNWSVPPLADRDANANSFLSAFDFEAGPRPPVLISPTREQAPSGSAPRLLIHSAYGGTLLLAAAVLKYGMPKASSLLRAARLRRPQDRAP
jgi:phospholipase C